MKNKKLSDILFFVGICIIIVGILLGTALGFIFGNGGFNLVPAITVWILCVIGGTGFVSVSGSINEAEEKKSDDEEMLRQIIENLKNGKDV